MPIQKLCKIEEKLKKEHLDIKSRYIKLEMQICSFNFKNNIIIIINRS